MNGASLARRFTAGVTTLALVLGMAVAMSFLDIAILGAGSARIKVAHADPVASPYSQYLGKTVTFCGNKWDVVGINDGDVSGTYLASGTIATQYSAMLLLHNENAGGNITLNQTRFDTNDNTYEDSTLQSVMTSQAEVCAGNLGADTVDGLTDFGVQNTSLTTSVTPGTLKGPAVGDGDPLTNQLFFPLSYSEALKIPDLCQNQPSWGLTDGEHTCPLRAFSLHWWLRSSGSSNTSAMYAHAGGALQGPAALSGCNYSSGYECPVTTIALYGRPALQISLDSFPKLTGAKITLANRKYDVIGAGDAPLVQPSGWTDAGAVPIMGDSGTVTLLYSRENVVGSGSSTAASKATSMEGQVDEDWIWDLSTSFNPDAEDDQCQHLDGYLSDWQDTSGVTTNNSVESKTNIYKNSCLAQRFGAIYDTWGNNAKDQIVIRDIPTGSNNTGSTNEAFGDNNPVADQSLWALSYNEAMAIPDGCQNEPGWDSYDDLHTCVLREFPHPWWLRSPGDVETNASYVGYGGWIDAGGSDVSNPGNLARPALQIPADSVLLLDIAEGKNVTNLTVSGDTTIEIGSDDGTLDSTVTTADSTAYTGGISWVSKNTDVATVDSDGVLTGLTEGTAEICAETELGEYQRCVSVTVSPTNCTNNRTACSRGDYIMLDGQRWDVVYVNNTGSDIEDALGEGNTQPAKTATLIYSNKNPADAGSAERYIYEDGTEAFCGTTCEAGHDPDNDYSRSDLRIALINRFDEWSDADKALVKLRTSFTDFCGGTSSEPLINCGTAGRDGLWAFSKAEADEIIEVWNKSDPWTEQSGTAGTDLMEFDTTLPLDGWWLRSPGNTEELGTSVQPMNGTIYTHYDVNVDVFFARPSLFLNLKPSLTLGAVIGSIQAGQSIGTPTVSGNDGSGAESVAGYVALANGLANCDATAYSGGTVASWSTDNAVGYYCAKVDVAETANYLGGSAYAKFKVLEATPSAGIDYVNEKLTGLDPDAYYTVGEDDVQADEFGQISIAPDWFGLNDVEIVKINADDTLDSADQELDIDARPTAPTASFTPATTKAGYIEIQGLTNLLEYATSMDGYDTWTAVDPTASPWALSGYPSGILGSANEVSYKFRTKAVTTDGSKAFHSAETGVLTPSIAADTGAPTGASNLAVFAPQNGGLTFGWSAGSDVFDPTFGPEESPTGVKYAVKYGTTPAPTTATEFDSWVSEDVVEVTTDADELSQDITGLTNGVLYNFVVKTYDEAGNAVVTTFASSVNAVSFNTDGGSVAPPTQYVLLGDKVDSVANPTKTGYSFEEWHKDNVSGLDWLIGVDEIVTFGNFTLYAGYDQNIVTVSFADCSAEGFSKVYNANREVTNGAGENSADLTNFRVELEACAEFEDWTTDESSRNITLDARGATFTFNDPSVAGGDEITVGGTLTLTGEDGDKWLLNTDWGTVPGKITRKQLTWASLPSSHGLPSVAGTVDDKFYDGGDSADVVDQPTLEGVQEGDSVAVNAGIAKFVDVNAGSSVGVEGSGWSADVSSGDGANYFTPESEPEFSNAEIKKAELTIDSSDVHAVSRPFTSIGDVSVVLTGSADLLGRFDDDIVNLGACTGEFDGDGSVGNDKDVIVTCESISGADSGNYYVADYTFLLKASVFDNYSVITLPNGKVIKIPANYTRDDKEGYVLPETSTDEVEILIDGVVVVVPGSSVINIDGTITLPETGEAFDVAIPDGGDTGGTVDVHVPGNSTLDTSTGTITMPLTGGPFTDVKIDGTPTDEPVDAGTVITTHVSKSEAITLTVINPTNAHRLDPFTAYGSGFIPGEVVRLELHSAPLFLGTARVLSDGTFTFNGNIHPDALDGSHDVVALDHNNPKVEHTSKWIIILPDIVPDGPYYEPASGVPGTGPLSVTGVNVTNLMLLMLMLLTLGGAGWIATSLRDSQ